MILALLDVLRAYPGQIPDVDAVLSVADFPCVPLCASLHISMQSCVLSPYVHKFRSLRTSADRVNGSNKPQSHPEQCRLLFIAPQGRQHGDVAVLAAGTRRVAPSRQRS